MYNTNCLVMSAFEGKCYTTFGPRIETCNWSCCNNSLCFRLWIRSNENGSRIAFVSLIGSGKNREKIVFHFSHVGQATYNERKKNGRAYICTIPKFIILYIIRTFSYETKKKYKGKRGRICSAIIITTIHEFPFDKLQIRTNRGLF
jgi:hypothetical protein